MAILYGSGTLACRHCSNFTYQTQRISPLCRSMTRAQLIRMRMGGSPDLDQPFPHRPKGMHEWTYTKLALKACRAEAQSNRDIATWVDVVKSRWKP